jgi:hypothetical protein
MPKVNRGKTVVVILSADEARAAIEHAAWCAAVDDDPSIAVKGGPILVRDADGSYRVQFSRVEQK